MQQGKTTVATIILLHFALFNSAKRIGLLSNKADSSREILDRIQMAYENLPKWMQIGVKEWNKGSVEFANESRIIAAASSSSSIRGKACVSGDTFITYENENIIYHTTIDGILTTMKNKEKKYIVYQITNKINGKIYIGFHSTYNINDGYMGSGRLIKRAIEKYGVENFDKVILKEFDNHDDAEKYEAELVTKEFTLMENTYNLAIGGNVRTMYGENNSFYGKKHSEETKKKIGQFHIGNKWFAYEILVRGKLCKGYQDAYNEYYGTTTPFSWVGMIDMIGDPAIDVRFKDDYKQKMAEVRYDKRQQELIEGKERLAECCSERFSGIPKSAEQRKKMSESGKLVERDWIAEKINKNPEKIRKTAEKHRGMKRSEKSKKRMSEAQRNKGKRPFYHPETKETGWYVVGEQPNDFIQGYYDESPD